MPRGILLSRAQHAAIRCEWATKRPLPEYDQLSDNQLQRKIGACYGFGYLAVGRAIRNSSRDNLDSDDDHCEICIEGVQVRRKERTLLGPEELDHSQGPSTSRRLARLPNPIAGPSTSAASNSPSLKDIIFVKSDDDCNPPTLRVRSSTSSSSPRKRKNIHKSSSESDGSDEWTPLSSLGAVHSPKKQRTRRLGPSANRSGVGDFLRSIDPAYLRHVPVLANLGITTREHLKKIQSMNPGVREKFLVRIEQGGVSAMERAIIEDAIMKLPD